MKRIKQFSIWIIALIGLMIANHPAWAADTQYPTPGGYQSGYPKAVDTKILVKWKRATDNVTTQANLRYLVGWKKKSASSWQYSHPEPLPKDMTTYTIENLEPNTEYVVDVRVVDEAGKGTWYGEKTVKTPADTQDPTAGGYQSGYPKATGTTTIEVKWKRGSDNVTTQANLRYLVEWKKKSGGSWQTSHSEPFTNYPKDMTSYTITGLEPNTEYVVNVGVFDEAGNVKGYGYRTVRTPAVPDTQAPTSGGYQSGYPKATGPTTIEVKWKRGSDNVTAPANLRYRVLWKKKSGGSWQNSHPAPFTNFPKDMTAYTITGLQPNTEYLVDVEVWDEAENFQWYGEKTVKTPADTQAPTPGGYQSGYPKAVGPTTIEVKWKRATDNVTAPSNLRYRVGWKKKSGGSWHYSHSDPSTNWPKDWTAVTLTGLEPNTEYVVDVSVADEAGNGKWSGEKTVKTLAADTEAPTPGGYVLGYPKAISAAEIEVKWTRGSDNETAPANLRYRVTWKEKLVGGWQYSHSEPFTNYPKDMTAYTITGLRSDTEYVVDVAVVDEAGNFQWYGTQTVKTKAAADIQKPTPGGYEAGYPKAVGTTTIEVKWTRGSDNVTTPANLRYRVGWKKKSGSDEDWQYSHPGHFTNLPKDMTSYTLTGLDPNTEYVVDVLVVDEAGNWKWYGEKTVTTGAGAADTEDPTPGGYTSVTSTTNSITLNWKRATDNVTAPANLRYRVSWMKKSGGSQQDSHPAPFTNFPKDMTSYTITGLEPNTEYFVDVVVVDEAGNYQFYGDKTVTTGAGAVDIQDPTPGGYEAGYPKAVGTTIEVKWKRATDNVTAPANLRYLVAWKKKSEGSTWQFSHFLPFTNYPKDWTEYTITGLEPNTEYYVVVGVVDEAGNGKDYDLVIVTTGAASVTIPVTGVTLSPASLNLEVGATKSLTHTVLPATATNKAVTWSSSNTAIATVDGSGTVKGIAPGTATITVTTADGGKTATAAVTVKAATAPAVKVTSVTLNRNSVTINGDYEEIKLTATVAPATATDQSLTWTSDNPSVASVDATGLVTIHKKGKARITVTANDGSGRYDACDFNVIMTVANETVDGLRMWAHGGALHLTLPNAATVHIYNVNGAIVKTLFLPSGDHVQPLADGMYLVRVGERVRKILVK